MSNIPVQIDYASRDYESLRQDLISLVNSQFQYLGVDWKGDDPSDFAVALIEAFAYMGDMLSYYIDRAANETSVTNATQIQTILDMASLYGTRPSGPVPATVNLTFKNNSTGPINIPVGTQVSVPLSQGPYSKVYFEVIQPVTGLAANASVTLSAVEGKTINTDIPGQIVNNKALPLTLGTSDGLADQEFLINDIGVVDGSITVYVGQSASFNSWTYVDNLVEYGPYDRVFTYKMAPSGKIKIIFGDGVNGYIPDTNETVSATYRVSIGASGNIPKSSANIAVTFMPGLDQSLITSLSVTNDTAASGGSDGDTLNTLRTKVVKAINARKRAVTASDYEALASNVANVSQAKLIGSSPSNVTLRLQILDDNSSTPGISDGVPTTQWYSTSSDVSYYLQDKIPIGTTLTVMPPVYVPIVMSLNINVKPEYRNKDIKLAVARQLLNAKEGLFGYANYGFGTDVYLSDVIYAINSLDGVRSISVGQLQRGALLTKGEVAGSRLKYTSNHTFKVGDTVTVSGMTPDTYNRSGTVYAADTSTFTLTLSGSGTLPSATSDAGVVGVAVTGSASVDVTINDHEIAYLPTTTVTINATGGVS